MSNVADFIEQQRAAGKTANRLVDQKSPYLLQHAFNPVQWLPWGEEAFSRARAEGKPIFLSIGYSTCHWCHVMAHESFEDQEVAALLNQYFIPVKVDREERPDIDQVYMAAVQALSGHGGWPLTVLLTPELKPFYGGTYFPPRPKPGMPGLVQVLLAVRDAWQARPEQLTASAAVIAEQLRQSALPGAGEGELGLALLDRAAASFKAAHDPSHGGFGRAPKFPRPVAYSFLLRHFLRGGDQQALRITLADLRHMAAGGVYDHIGGGFHRYAVDSGWRVPHFEKMLYDQAQLAVAYLEAFQLGQDPFFASVAQDILDYVLREMTSPEGGFHSAEDADSPVPENPTLQGEGAFYLWRRQEIVEVLGKEAGELFCFHYGVVAGGNVKDDPQQEFSGKNILYVAHTLEETASHFRKSAAEAGHSLERSRRLLREARQKRPRPHLDDKVIVSWNGLMISALARAYQVLGEQRYLDAALRAAGCIRERMVGPQDGSLLRRFRDHEAGLPGQLDDYAFLSQGLIDLYEASFDVAWLQLALAITERQLALFWDGDAGGFFDAPPSEEGLLMRMKSDYDGAEPAGNSVAALNLLRLAEIANRNSWREKGMATIRALGGRLQGQPDSLPMLLNALALAHTGQARIVVAGRPGRPDTEIMLAMLRKRLLPGRVLLLADGGEGQAWLSRFHPELAEIQTAMGKSTVYLCQGSACGLPITDLDELNRRLEALGPKGAR
ncbi:MAG: thioredoxin domain-containing protein [Thermodesulfobacteriota bacterium]